MKFVKILWCENYRAYGTVTEGQLTSGFMYSKCGYTHTYKVLYASISILQATYICKFITCIGTYKTIEGSVANVLGQLVAASLLYFIGKQYYISVYGIRQNYALTLYTLYWMLF